MPAGRPSTSVEIYALADPADGAVRYIGKARDAAKRLKAHLRDAKRRNTPVYCWMRKLVAEGRVPTVMVLSVCDEADWKMHERAAIAAGRDEGLRLLNLADGGDEPFCFTETRQANGRKVAASRDKRLWQLKRDLGRSLQKGWVSEATKEKMRARPDVFGQFAVYL